jgi:YYY domain-containing protein
VAEAITWWLIIELLGLLSLIPAFLLFSSLPDRGYGLAKPLGLLLVAYTLWVVAWAGFLPNTRSTLVFILFLLALASALTIAWRGLGGQLLSFLRRSWRVIVATELVFGLAFFAFALFRAYLPAIAGTEQPMDFSFLNASLRSRYFPPPDPWLSGYTISYYYFGYLIQSIPIKLSGIPSAIGYNLALSSLFALTAVGAFSLGYNLVAPRRARAGVVVGIVAAALVVLVGNLEGALEMLRSHGLGAAALWRWIGIKGALIPYQSAAWYPTEHFWWWHATRVINTLRITTGPGGAILNVDDTADYTITEFPFFSFMLGDLHPHLMALPFALLALGLALGFLRRERPLRLAWVVREPLAFGGTALALGALGFINSWDLPTYTVILFGAILLGAFWQGRPSGAAVLSLLALLVLLGLTSIFLYLPFYLGPRPQTQGLGLVTGVGTRPVHFIIIWGLFLFALGSLFLARLGRAAAVVRAKPYLALGALVASLVPFALWTLGQAILPQLVPSLARGPLGPLLASKGLSLLPLVVVVAFLIMLLLGVRRWGDRSEAFALLLALGGFALTMGVELFFIRDAFGNRMNTVFKFYYQGWVLFAIASAYGIYFVATEWRPTGGWRILRVAWALGLGVFVVMTLAYPVAASYTRANGFLGKPSLDGLAFVRRQDPGEYEAIRWLNTQVQGSPVILEASGGSYTEYGRVSSRTGLPTLVEWPGHQVQWRGAQAVLSQRQEVVDQIYRSEDREQVLRLLKRFGVSYVYVGRLERAKYGEEVTRRLASFLKIAFQSRGVTIYRVGEGLLP